VVLSIGQDSFIHAQGGVTMDRDLYWIMQLLKQLGRQMKAESTPAGDIKITGPSYAAGHEFGGTHPPRFMKQEYPASKPPITKQALTDAQQKAAMIQQANGLIKQVEDGNDGH